MKKAGIIINPNAKKIRTGKTSLDKYKKLVSDNIDLRISNGLHEIKSIAQDFKAKNIDYIAIAGGDGTVHLTLTEIIKAYLPGEIPPILILKEGTMDNIARTIKLKGNGLYLLKKLIKALDSGKDIQTFRRNTIQIEDRYCFLFGTGMITNFLNEVYNGKEKGLVRNIQVGIKTIKEAVTNTRDGIIFNFLKEDIKIDGKEIGFDSVSGILAGTVEHVGMSFSPLKEAVSNETGFQTLITGMEPRKMLLNINKFRRGKKIKSSEYCNLFANEMQISCPNEFDYTMDGDIYKAKDFLMIKMGPPVELVKL